MLYYSLLATQSNFSLPYFVSTSRSSTQNTDMYLYPCPTFYVQANHCIITVIVIIDVRVV